MIFQEIYGCYYRCIEKMINLAIDGELDENKMLEVIHDNAFEESHLQIMPALQEHKWQLFDDEMHTPFKHHSTLPLTYIEKQWLKAISLDPKIKLFHVDFSSLDNIEPLFTQDDFLIYDQYTDGDPYDSELYQHIFQTILKAIHEKRKIKVHYHKKDIICIPYRIEYSLKDDKFRLITLNNRKYKYLNISKIHTIELLDHYPQNTPLIQHTPEYIVLKLYDERNALERVMTHFADLQKQAEQINENIYKIKLYYEKEDETEMVIRVLSFGPMLKVIEPNHFVNLIKERLKNQKSCGLR